MVTMTGQAGMPSWKWDPSAGSHGEAAMTGGAGLATLAATAGGLGATTGLLQVNDGQRMIDKRLATTSMLGLGAAAATSAAAFSQVAGPGGAVAAAGLGVLATAINGGLAAYDAQKSIAALNQIAGEIEGGQHTDAEAEDMDTVYAAVQYCIGKQGVKKWKGAANASMAGQPLVPLYKAGKAINKFAHGTKGVNRATHARTLVNIAQKEVGRASEYARRVIAVVVARNFEDIMADAVANAMKSG